MNTKDHLERALTYNERARTEIQLALESLGTEPPVDPPTTPGLMSAWKSWPVSTAPISWEGMLWKPESESNGNLVVLLHEAIPEALRARGVSPKSAIEIWDYAGTQVLAKPERFSQNGHNANRGHWWFDRPGAFYGQCLLALRGPDGRSWVYPIEAGANRYESIKPRWSPVLIEVPTDPVEPPVETEPTNSLGHPLFMEAQGANTYGTKGSWCAVTFNRMQPGTAPCAVWHPWYHPEHTTDPGQIGRFQAAGESRWRKVLIDEFVSACKKLGVQWAGIDWEGLLLTRGFRPVLEDQSRALRANGIKVIHWPAVHQRHQIEGGFFSSKTEMRNWQIQYCDAIGWWHGTVTIEQYQAVMNEYVRAGFRGPQYALAYPLKGVSHEEDKRICAHPNGGIFNPKSNYDLVKYAQQTWT